MRHARLLGEVTPQRPGPGPLPPELLRALQIEVSRRLESALAYFEEQRATPYVQRGRALMQASA